MKWIIILLGLLFAIGCSSATVYVCADGSEVSDPQACPSNQQAEDNVDDMDNIYELVKEEIQEADYSVSAEEEALLESRFTSDKRVDISRELVTEVHQGDIVVLGLGIRNILGQTIHDFVIDIDFVEMRDFSNSVFDTDDALLEAWFRMTNFGQYTLERTDEIVVPLIIEVGDMMTAENPVVPGNYIFDINVNYLTNAGTDPYETVRLTLQIEE